MRVFKLFFQLVRAYKLNFIIYGAVFIGMSLMFVFVTTKEQQDYTELKTKVSIYYDQETPLTTSLVNHLRTYTEVVDLPKNQIDDSLYYEVIEVAIFLPNDLHQVAINNLETIEFQSNLNNAVKTQTVSLQINKYLNSYRLLYEADSSLTEEQITNKLNDILFKRAEAVIPNSDKKDTSGIKFFFNFASYIIFSTLFGSIILIITKMKRHHVYKRTVVASYSQSRFSIEISIASFVLSLAVMLFVFILALILDYNVFASYKGLLYFINLMLYTLAVTSISIALGFIINNEDVIGMFSVLLSLIMAFFSGAFIPLELLSHEVQTIGHIFPAYYFILNNNLISEMTSFDITKLIGNAAVIVGFVILFVFIGIIINKKQVKKEIG